MNRDIFVKHCAIEVGNTGKKYWDYFSLETDWCAMFVSYMMREKANISTFPKTASCSMLKSLMKDKVNSSFNTAEVGDIILFETHNPEDGPDHVGIVVSNNFDKKTLTLVEGNTTDRNYRKSSVNYFEYPYFHSSFDSIIDMSSFFSDAVDEDKNRIAIQKIKQILAELEV